MSSAEGNTADDAVRAIGRTDRRVATIVPERAAAMAATLDIDAHPAPGAPLPPGWHWLYFNPFVPRRELGPDGHPRRGDFLPDTGLPRRMWAGGRLLFHADIPLGAEAERQSEIVDVAPKRGRAGRLVFVTLRHRILVGGTLCLEEEQDIVNREAPDPGAPKPVPPQAPSDADWSEEVVPDPVLLFRYSALTSNGHRIHYDWPYVTGVEGYPGLVVHGPLVATLLQGFAQKCRPGRRLRRFSFRATAPLFADEAFRLEAARGPSHDRLEVWARGPQGELAMKAEAVFAA